MRCRACDQPMTAGAVQTCPACGRTVTFRDLGYVPSAGFQPVPYRAETFAPLEEERGWEQSSPDLVLAMEETPRERAQRERRERETPAQREAMIAKRQATRAKNRAAALAREAKYAQRQATRAIEAATRARARNGARTGKWYAEQRGAA